MQTTDLLVDWQRVLNIAGERTTLAYELLDMFSNDLPQLSQEIQTAHAENNLTALSQHAHKLVGSSSYCAATPLLNLARRVEKAARADDKVTIDSLMPELVELVKRTQTALEAIQREKKE